MKALQVLGDELPGSKFSRAGVNPPIAWEFAWNHPPGFLIRGARTVTSASLHIQDPDIRGTLLPLKKSDALPVGRPGRMLRARGRIGHLGWVGSIGRDLPDVRAPCPVGHKGDATAIWRPSRPLIIRRGAAPATGIIVHMS